MNDCLPKHGNCPDHSSSHSSVPRHRVFNPFGGPMTLTTQSEAQNGELQAHSKHLAVR